MPNVRVLMMQHDEGDALTRWLAHYSGLFGFENLSIVDNASKDPYTLNLLRKAEQCGVTIYWGFDTVADSTGKGGHFVNIIRSWDVDGKYDFALPLDCDEILAVFTPEGLTTDHAAIQQELDSLRGARNALRIDMSLFNVVGRPGWFAPNHSFYKGFLPARSVESIDNGQHEPKSKLEPGHRVTNLTYLHWHNKPYEVARASARRRLTPFVNVDDPSALASYLAFPGGAPECHLVDLLCWTEEAYLRRYDSSVKVFVPPSGTSNLFMIGQEPHVWSAEHYLRQNEDVRASSSTVLHHYLRYGFSEGRHLS